MNVSSIHVLGFDVSDDIFEDIWEGVSWVCVVLKSESLLSVVWNVSSYKDRSSCKSRIYVSSSSLSEHPSNKHTLPVKSTALDLLSRITNMKGWSTMTGWDMELSAIWIHVTAVASEPSSLISMYDLCIIWNATETQLSLERENSISGGLNFYVILTNSV